MNLASLAIGSIVGFLMGIGWIFGHQEGWQEGWRDCCRVNGLPDPREVVSSVTFDSYQGKDRR